MGSPASFAGGTHHEPFHPQRWDSKHISILYSATLSCTVIATVKRGVNVECRCSNRVLTKNPHVPWSTLSQVSAPAPSLRCGRRRTNTWTATCRTATEGSMITLT